MTRSNLNLHRAKLSALILITHLLLLINLAIGELKALEIINWVDVLGEGGAVLLTLMWIGLLLNSRPKGRVTNLLSFGLLFIFMSTFQDLLDEAIAFPEHLKIINKIIESGAMPIGMILLTWGLYHWNKEQLVINEQLVKRERIFREHRSIDPVTQLSSASYLKQQIHQEIVVNKEKQQSFALLLLDIDFFDQLNHRYGDAEGDRLLLEISELILLNLRRCDLLCRYAGDRFAVLLPNSVEHMAELLSEQLRQAVKHFAYKTQYGETVYCNISIAYYVTHDESPEAVLEKVTQRLENAKQQRDQRLHAA